MMDPRGEDRNLALEGVVPRPAPCTCRPASPILLGNGRAWASSVPPKLPSLLKSIPGAWGEALPVDSGASGHSTYLSKRPGPLHLQTRIADPPPRETTLPPQPHYVPKGQTLRPRCRHSISRRVAIHLAFRTICKDVSFCQCFRSSSPLRTGATSWWMDTVSAESLERPVTPRTKQEAFTPAHSSIPCPHFTHR